MAVTRERFEQGMTYEQYKAQMTQNLDRFEDAEKHAKFSAEDLEFFADLLHPVNVLVLTEDWCGDALVNVPVVGRLAQETNQLNVRILLRDQNLDIMDQYLKDGQYRSIPVYIFFDQNFRELGHWIERPAKVTELRNKALGELFASDPLFANIAPGTSPADMSEEARNRWIQSFIAFRLENRALMDSEVVRETRAVIERGLAKGSAVHSSAQ